MCYTAYRTSILEPTFLYVWIRMQPSKNKLQPEHVMWEAATTLTGLGSTVYVFCTNSVTTATCNVIVWNLFPA